MQNGEAEYSSTYQDFALYSIAGDPAETLNLIGRPEYKDVAAHLRSELLKRIIAADEPETETTITPIHYYA